ncbi:hypothetical protein [Thiomonas sp. FB-Cd]|uniref:hypothetical protein n=1 Tax=Thiomonas sp. FB-Cd TaxID=1158292 RepID=UPI0004DFA6BB|nr:hypothetical protein [Thiomonas sp. FB-Cd]
MRTRLPDWRHALAAPKRACGICQSAALMVVCLVMLAALMAGGRKAQAAADMPGSSPGAALPVAQVIAPTTDGAPERAAERRQIRQQRRDLDAAYAHQQAACQRRFFVNQCLQDASRRYRSAAGSLEAQLNALDLAAREQRAAAERARVERNVRERQQPNVKPIQTQPTELGQEQADKQRRQAERQEREAAHEAAYAAKQEQATKRLQRSPKPYGKVRPRVPTPAAHTSQPESAYAAKLADYQRRQRDAARRAQQKPPAPPLPLPPGY